MSDEKKSQGGGFNGRAPKTNVNDSYLMYYDEASMIKEAPHDEEDEESNDSYQFTTNDNRQDPINIIDYH